MNCENFQENRSEWIEGSLTPERALAMNSHAAECSACRQQCQAEQAVAQTLSRAFREQVNPLTLPADFSKRLISALAEPTPAKAMPVKVVPKTLPLREVLVAGWRRYFWPMALAVCLVFSFGGFHFIFSDASLTHEPRGLVTVVQTESQVSIQCHFRVPTLTFHREGNRVVDTISYQTVVTSESLPRNESEAGAQKQTGKTPL